MLEFECSVLCGSRISHTRPRRATAQFMRGPCLVCAALIAEKIRRADVPLCPGSTNRSLSCNAPAGRVPALTVVRTPPSVRHAKVEEASADGARGRVLKLTTPPIVRDRPRARGGCRTRTPWMQLVYGALRRSKEGPIGLSDIATMVLSLGIYGHPRLPLCFGESGRCSCMPSGTDALQRG